MNILRELTLKRNQVHRELQALNKAISILSEPQMDTEKSVDGWEAADQPKKPDWIDRAIRRSTEENFPPQNRLSAAGRRAISDMMKRRWARWHRRAGYVVLRNGKRKYLTAR